MIGSIHEFVLAARRQIDDKIKEQDGFLTEGALIVDESAEHTAIAYSRAVGFRNGLRYAKTEIIDELVKRMNEGGL